MNICINSGTVDSVATLGVAPGDVTAPVQLGDDSNGDYWDGRIGPVAFWKRVLSSDERALLWNQGNGLAYPFERLDRTARNLRSRRNHGLTGGYGIINTRKPV